MRKILEGYSIEKSLKKSISTKLILSKEKEKQEDLKEANSHLYQTPKLYNLDAESKCINKNLTTIGRIFAILSNRKM